MGEVIDIKYRGEPDFFYGENGIPIRAYYDSAADKNVMERLVKFYNCQSFEDARVIAFQLLNFVVRGVEQKAIPCFLNQAENSCIPIEFSDFVKNLEEIKTLEGEKKLKIALYLLEITAVYFKMEYDIAYYLKDENMSNILPYRKYLNSS